VPYDRSRLIFDPPIQIVCSAAREVFDGFNTLCAERHEHQRGNTRNTFEFVRNTEFSSLCIKTSLGVRSWLGIGFGNVGHRFASMGPQALAVKPLQGYHVLHELRFAPEFAQRSVIWPFETGWATKARWLPEEISIVHAEIYPSVRVPLADDIKDRGQVRSMWEWASELDRQDLLWFEFGRPIEIEPGSPGDITVQLTEGWILGSSPTVRQQ
jgi:hypothetical protein